MRKLFLISALLLGAGFTWIENVTHAYKVASITGAPYMQVLAPVARVKGAVWTSKR